MGVFLIAVGCLLALPVSAVDDDGPSTDPPPAEAERDESAQPQSRGQAPRQYSVPAWRQANHIAVISIQGEIDRVTDVSLKRRMELAVRNGAEAIVLDINTPGGELNATLDICTMIKSEFPPNTVAWINPTAYSAGTIIALAAREIIVHPNATFGDSAPVTLVPLPTAERAKIESPLLVEVIDSARRNHYDENLVQAFVSVGVELWMLENVDTGDRIFVDRNEYHRIFGESPPDEILRTIPESARGTGQVAPWIGRLLGGDEGGEVSDEELRRQREYALSRPSVRPKLGPDDRDSWRPLGQVVNDQRLLTLKPEEAKEYGLAVAIVANEQDLRNFFGAADTATVRYYHEDWAEKMARFMMSWTVRVLLITIFIVGFFLEMATPGMGIFGAAAFAALLLLFGTPAILGLANFWALLLILLGITLIIVEIFVTPGIGLAGLGGLLSLFLGMVGMFVAADFSGGQDWSQVWSGVAGTLIAMFAAGTMIWLAARHVQSFRLTDRLVLKHELASPVLNTGSSGTIGSVADSSADDSSAGGSGIAVGQQAVAATDLHPSGRIQVGERLVDAQSTGGYIAKGSPVRIVSVGRYTTFVEEE